MIQSGPWHTIRSHQYRQPSEYPDATLPDPHVKRDDQTVVPGNSKSDRVITQTAGKLLAIGPQGIEVDNPVYPGNTGSPIVHTDSVEVIGILTKGNYSHSTRSRSSLFDRTTRRSATSVTGSIPYDNGKP